ncbi:fatty acid--CoA ligase [Streptosporangium sp. NPDC002607]
MNRNTDTFPLRTLASVAAHHSASTPQAVAVMCEGRRTTYAELDHRSGRTAHHLVALGVVRGSRVAYLGKDSEDYYELLLACARIGAVLVPINWRLTSPEIQHILRDSDAKLVFVESALVGTVDQVKESLPALEGIIPLNRPGRQEDGLQGWNAGTPESTFLSEPSAEDPLVQIYTSGTTGMPKGVVLTQQGFFVVRELLARNGLDWIDWLPDDKSLVGMPGFHIGGLWWFIQGFCAGVTNVIMPTFDSRKAVELIRSHHVTTICVVPAMLQMMLSERETEAGGFPSLRKVTYGGSPISGRLLQECMDVFQCGFAQIYGLTETGNTAVCLPPERHVPGGSHTEAAGIPYPGIQLEIRDEKGVPLPVGAVGEVCIRTPARMLGYWKLPEATSETLVDGWIRTGDAGYLDAEGYLFICDRIKDMIITAGENIYPAEIENALATHPAIKECAVIGIPDDRWGEVVSAYVVPRPGAHVTARDLMLFLRGRIADFKIPRQFNIIDQVPRNASGKILRRKLRSTVADMPGRSPHIADERK